MIKDILGNVWFVKLPYLKIISSNSTEYSDSEEVAPINDTDEIYAQRGMVIETVQGSRPDKRLPVTAWLHLMGDKCYWISLHEGPTLHIYREIQIKKEENCTTFTASDNEYQLVIKPNTETKTWDVSGFLSTTQLKHMRGHIMIKNDLIIKTKVSLDEAAKKYKFSVSGIPGCVSPNLIVFILTKKVVKRDYKKVVVD